MFDTQRNQLYWLMLGEGRKDKKKKKKKKKRKDYYDGYRNFDCRDRTDPFVKFNLNYRYSQ